MVTNDSVLLFTARRCRWNFSDLNAIDPISLSWFLIWISRAFVIGNGFFLIFQFFVHNFSGIEIFAKPDSTKFQPAEVAYCNKCRLSFMLVTHCYILISILRRFLLLQQIKLSSFHRNCVICETCFSKKKSHDKSRHFNSMKQTYSFLTSFIVYLVGHTLPFRYRRLFFWRSIKETTLET